VRELNGTVRFTRADAAQLKVTALDFNGYPAGPAGTAEKIKLQPSTIYYVIGAVAGRPSRSRHYPFPFLHSPRNRRPLRLQLDLTRRWSDVAAFAAVFTHRFKFHRSVVIKKVTASAKKSASV
jgi:hypothetical protein